MLHELTWMLRLQMGLRIFLLIALAACFIVSCHALPKTTEAVVPEVPSPHHVQPIHSIVCTSAVDSMHPANSPRVHHGLTSSSPWSMSSPASLDIEFTITSLHSSLDIEYATIDEHSLHPLAHSTSGSPLSTNAPLWRQDSLLYRGIQLI